MSDIKTLSDNKIYKIVNEIFQIYQNYKFKINNYALLEESNLKIDSENYKKMLAFSSLVERAMDSMRDDDKNMIKLAYIDHIHYSQSSCSQSAYFTKRKIASKKFLNLLLDLEEVNNIASIMNLLKLN